MSRTRARTINPNCPNRARSLEQRNILRSPSRHEFALTRDPPATQYVVHLRPMGEMLGLPIPPSESVPPTVASRKSTSVGGVSPCGILSTSRSSNACRHQPVHSLR